MHYHKKQRRFRAPNEGGGNQNDEMFGAIGESRDGHAKSRFRSTRKSRAARAAEQDLFLSALSGLDASEDLQSQGGADKRGHHKTLMLCRQVMRALSQALAGECGDDMLRDLWVQAVQPCGGTGHLRVMVILPAGVLPADALARLEHHAGRLRQAVSRAISRKRTPQLIYVPVFMSGSLADECDAPPSAEPVEQSGPMNLPGDDSLLPRSLRDEDFNKESQ